jgi:hypothetical protein
MSTAAILNPPRIAGVVIVSCDPPPIPTRAWDYRATLEGYAPGDPIGWGASEDEAIADLAESLKLHEGDE